MNNSLLPSLEKAFRCQIHGLKPRRNVYVAKTDRGIWIIKGYEQKEKAEWVTQLAEVLQEKGFYHTVQYQTHSGGGKVLKLGERYYTIMKAIDGREASYASLYDITRSMLTLARFHRAAQGFSPPLADQYQVPLLQKWEDRFAHFEKIAQSIAAKGPQNRLEQLIHSMGKEVRRDSQEVLLRAASMPLRSEWEQVFTLGTMAHRDVASHNFLLTDKGSCYLIDLDTVSFDMQLVDLVQFMGRMLLLQGYSLAAFTKAIDAYMKINHLSDVQIWMIHQLLRYPDNFLREVTGVYAKRPGYRARGVQQLLLLERRFRRERRSFLQAEREIFQRPPWGQNQIVGL